jgi:TRAP-type C4-dicarboxylate transport system substrate-binding protein
MSGQEMMAGLERGVIDALTTALCFGYKQEFWRVAKNVYNWNIAPMAGWAVLANNDLWAKVPADLQATILKEMGVMQEEMFRDYYANTRTCIKGMVDKGVTFEVAKSSEVARLFAPENTAGVYKWWYERAKEVGFDGEAYVQRTRDLLGVDIN